MAISKVVQDSLNGGVAGTGPAFSASHSTGGDQSVSANTWTKVLYETEEYDTASCFSSSRFTPNVAGYYQVNASLYGGGTLQQMVYKNGSQNKYVGSNAGSGVVQGSCVVYLNGSSDYIEIYGNTTSTAFYTSSTNIWFQATLVKAA